MQRAVTSIEVSGATHLEHDLMEFESHYPTERAVADWQLIAVLIVFLRANRGSFFQYSVISILNSEVFRSSVGMGATKVRRKLENKKQIVYSVRDTFERQEKDMFVLFESIFPVSVHAELKEVSLVREASQLMLIGPREVLDKFYCLKRREDLHPTVSWMKKLVGTSYRFVIEINDFRVFYTDILQRYHQNANQLKRTLESRIMVLEKRKYQEFLLNGDGQCLPDKSDPKFLARIDSIDNLEKWVEFKNEVEQKCNKLIKKNLWN